MIIQRDIGSIIPPLYATYVARDLGTVDVGKIICSFDEALMSPGGIILFKKGNLFLDRFNILMRCYLEAGTQERLWRELHHRASLRVQGDLEKQLVTWFSRSLLPTYCRHVWY
jgi:hypothetical protein